MADSSQHGSSQASSSGRLSWPMRTSPPGSGSVGSDSSTSRAWSRRKTMGASLGGRQLSKKASLEKLQTYGSCIAWFEEDNSQWPATLDDYELQEVCGKGASATVFRAERKSDGYVVAIKRIDLELFGENMDIVMREAMIMRQQRHGHVLPLFTAFLHEHSLHMVMPYVAGGAVTQIMAKCCPQGFTPTVVATIAKAVLEGLAYLHQRGCIHRDVKAENVLIEGSGHVVLADFGVTAVMEQAESNPKANRRSREVVCRDSASSHEGADSAKKHHCYLARHTFVGTPSHMAPEIMEQDAGYYESADIWAFGMLLIELARGRAPYANFSLTNIIMMTLHSDPPELDSDCHCEPLREVVAQCLVHEPGERPTAAKLLKHRFFKMAKDDTWLKEELFRNVESVAPYYNGSMHGGLRKSSSASFFSKSLNYTNSHATLLRDASRAASTLRNACSRKRSPELRMKPESLLTCEAVAFVQVLPMRNHDAGFGHGFLCTKLEDGQGNISWSAPVFFDLIIPGATAEFRHIECCFVIPDGPSLQAFVQARPILGTGAPVSRDVELGLASRRQILRQLDRTLLGNLQVAPGASSSDPSMHSRHHSSTTLMEAFNNLPPPDSVPKPVQDGLYQEGNVSAQAASKHTPTDGAAAGNSPPSILSGSVAASAGTAKGYQVPFSPFGAPAPQQAAPLPALATSENSSTVGSSSIHDWSPTCKMPMQASIPELAEQGYSGPVVVTEQGQDTPEGLILGAQVSGTVTLPEVPPPAEVAVEAGVAAARGGQQPPDQQKGQLQGQAAADVPEGQGQQQLQAQVVSDTPEQPALQQQQQQQQQQSPPQGAAGALQRRWDRLKCGPLGHGKSERANTLKPLQRQASAEALTTPQRQASAETLQPLQRQASADTLKPLPSSSDRGQWQATSNFQAPLQRQRSAGHTRKVSMDGSGRPPKSPTVGSLQSPQRAPAPPGAQGPALKRTASAHDMHGRLPAAALAKPGPVRRRRKFPDRTKSGSLEDAPPPQQLPIMYAYGVAEPYLMNCPCKMSLKYACVTMNSDYNNRLYGGRMLGTILAGNVPVPPAMNSFHTALNRIFEKGRDPEKQKAWYLRVENYPSSYATVKVVQTDPLAWKGDLLVVGIYSCCIKADDVSYSITDPALQELDGRLEGAITEFLHTAEFSGKPGSAFTGRIAQSARYLTIVGLGPKDKAKVQAEWGVSPYQSLGLALASAAKTHRSKTAAAYIAGDVKEEGAEGKIAAGALLGAYEATRFKSKVKPVTTLEQVEVVVPPKVDVATGQKAVDHAVAMAKGALLTRYLVEAPPNVCTPTHLATAAQQIAAGSGGNIECTILERDDCAQLGMGCYLGVAEASEEPPKFIHLTYKPQGEVKRRVALVGKGLTMDTGGYNLKVGASMIEYMKFDMGGSGGVLGAAKALSLLKPEGVEVHFCVASCENMVDGKGMLPGDILKAANGKTVEVINTDAEGRLTLADALWYAETKCNAEAIVDIATLTGACMIALGDKVGGMFSPDDQMAESLSQAAARAGESLWRLPLEERYWEGCKSIIADMKNVGGGRFGGAITAALFLKRFVDTEKTQWAHLDIAGPCWSDKEGGATGFGAATLAEWVLSQQPKA